MGESGRGGNDEKVPVDSLQVLLRARPHPTVKHPAAYRRVRRMERIHGRLKYPLNLRNRPQREHTDLEIQLPEVIEEHFDPVVVLGLMQNNELHVYFS